MLSYQIDNAGPPNNAAWPLKLIETLPLLTKNLLERGRLISLERLQLVSLDFVLVGSELAPEPVTLEREKVGTHSFVQLAGLFALESGTSARVLIRYAERGAKKFFVPPMTQSSGETRALAPITANDVKAFYKAIGQDNPLFYDAKLAELNGFPSLFVPSELLMMRLMLEAETTASSNFMRYSFSFWQAIPQDEELLLSLSEDKKVWIIKAQESGMVKLVVA